MSISLRFDFAVGDIKQAFLQSDPLHRSKGPVLVEPCEGLPLAKTDLIELDVAVYGLDDAPFDFRQSLVRHLQSLGFTRTLLDPCWWILRTPNEKKRQDTERRLRLGKYETGCSEFCGRAIQKTETGLEVHVTKYIVERIQEIPLSRSRKAQHGDKLAEMEFSQLRSLVFRINWVGQEARPEVRGSASMLAAQLPQASVKDLLVANSVARCLRTTAERTLKLQSIPVEELHLSSLFLRCRWSSQSGSRCPAARGHV